MLKGNASVCVEETNCAIISGGSDSAGVEDAFHSEVPELNILHVLDLVQGKLSRENSSLFRTKVSSSKSGKVAFFLIGRIGSRSSWTWGWRGGEG